jgi:threonyl-tRNA synthetase
MITISFPDGNQREYEAGITPMQIAESISQGLARNVISAKVNGNKVETTTAIHNDANIKLLTFDDAEGKEAFWHSSAHLMAQAILKFYPEAKLTIGPPIDHGFYYDIDFGEKKNKRK